jgi:hypothetical protein
VILQSAGGMRALGAILAEAQRTSPSGPSGHFPPQGEDLGAHAPWPPLTFQRTYQR